MIGLKSGLTSVVKMADDTPINFTSAQVFINDKKSEFIVYTVCPKYDSIYDANYCASDVQRSPCCIHIPFPNHPQESKRQKCDSVLMKEVKYGTKCKLYPKKVYPYYSLQKSLDRLTSTTDFINMCSVLEVKCVNFDASDIDSSDFFFTDCNK